MYSTSEQSGTAVVEKPAISGSLQRAKDATDTSRKKLRNEYTRREIDDWFEKKLKHLPDKLLIRAYAEENYPQFYSACLIYRRYKDSRHKYSNDWYGFL